MLPVYALVVADSNLGKKTVPTGGFRHFSHTFQLSLRPVSLALKFTVYNLPANRYSIMWDPGRVTKWTKSSVSDVAHGNFSVETPPSQDIPVQSDVYVEKKHTGGQGDLPGTYTTEPSER